MITDDEMHKAIDRIARSDDGELLYRYFQRILCAVTTDPAQDSALRELEGRRKFAASLIGLMAKGIQESGLAATPSITFAVAGPRAISSPGGAGRRVTLDTAGPAGSRSAS